MRHTYSPFLLKVGPGAEPELSLQIRSTAAVNGGGEPSSMTTVPFTMIGYVLAEIGLRNKKKATNTQTPPHRRIGSIRTRTAPRVGRTAVAVRIPWSLGPC